jgi:hypothetical protein
MPAILFADDYDVWLDRGLTNVRDLSHLLNPYPAALMKSHPVGREVGDVRREGVQCAAPLNIALPGRGVTRPSATFASGAVKSNVSGTHSSDWP